MRWWEAWLSGILPVLKTGIKLLNWQAAAWLTVVVLMQITPCELGKVVDSGWVSKVWLWLVARASAGLSLDTAYCMISIPSLYTEVGKFCA